MRRPVLTALLTTCAVAIGITVSAERTAISAEPGDQASRPRPLSSVPPVERFGQAALAAQSEFLQRMPDAEVRHGDNGAVSWIKGRTGIVLRSGLGGFKVGQPSKELLEKIGPALLAAGTEELRVVSIATEAAKADAFERASSPERGIRTVQYIRGLEVQRSAVNIVLNNKTNEIELLVADFLPDRGLPDKPKLTAAEARAKVEAAMRDSGLEEEQKFIFKDEPARLAYAFEDIGNNGGIGGALVWVFQASSGDVPVEANVNASTGEVVRVRRLLLGFLPNRISYTANNTASFPNGLIFTFGEGGVPPDQVALDAYNNAGATFSMFDQVFGLNSWNGSGAPIRLVTHYGAGAGNAFYGLGGWLLFNDGDANTKPTAEDLDAVAHEYTHGIVEARTGINDPSGPVDGAAALSEGFGDWGAAVADAHQHSGIVGPSTWQIGALNRSNPLDGLRNLQAPITEDMWARDWYPSRTFILGSTSRYRNSTIMGHAYYLLTNGGQHYRAGLPGSEVPVIPVSGLGYEAARNIFYYSLNTLILTPNSTFLSLKSATLTAALPSQQPSVSQAWQAVGVGYNCVSPPQPPQVTVWPGYCRGRNRLEWPGVAGATKYDGQLTRQELGWAFAATVVDANVTSCQQNVPQGFWLFRLRACNGCGCSAWSAERYMEYWSGPCA